MRIFFHFCEWPYFDKNRYTINLPQLHIKGSIDCYSFICLLQVANTVYFVWRSAFGLLNSVIGAVFFIQRKNLVPSAEINK